jgi:hypothetical protein
VKKTFKQFKRSNGGYALLITIIFVGLALLLLGSVMNWTNTTAKQTELNNLFNVSTAAAEADTELVIAQMTRDFFNQSLQPTNIYIPLYITTANQTNYNWPVKFAFSDGAGNANQTSVSTVPTVYTTNWTRINAVNSAYSNLWATIANCTVISTATAIQQPYEPHDVSATVRQQFQLCSIPIFQFAIFYNMNMEICPGANMTVNGKTHVNGQIWADPAATLTFNDMVETTASNIIYSRNTNNDDQANTANPKVVYLYPNGSTNSPSLSADSLTMPLGTNLVSLADILDLSPAGVLPYSAVGQEYLNNQADIIVSNSSSGQLSVYYQNSNSTPQLQLIPPITNVVSHVTNVYYSFLTNVSFYDYREKDTVKAVQLSVTNFGIWVTNNSTTNGGLQYNNQNTTGTTSKGHAINSVYIYNSVPPTSSQRPAVRVANGSVLPSQGLTVATPQPIYVLGNYNASGSSLNNGTNVVNAAPAALIGDAVTVLSTSWNDNYTSGTSLSSRSAGNTTINAATFEGIVVSTNIGGTKYYSGGVENFLRLLEDWGNGTKTLTYNGSIVVMFASRYATNHYQDPGKYYNFPIRAWGFDVNFLQQNQLPPISPQVKTLIPTGWSVY